MAGRSPFKTILWIKVALALALVVVSYLHNYVYGPRLQREIREHGTQTTRPTLVAIGWTSFASPRSEIGSMRSSSSVGTARSSESSRASSRRIRCTSACAAS